MAQGPDMSPTTKAFAISIANWDHSVEHSNLKIQNCCLSQENMMSSI